MTAPRRAARKHRTPPAGLVAAFKMIATDQSFAATKVAAASYPHARRIITLLENGASDDATCEELEHATFTLFPDLKEPAAATTAQEAAFNCGFAVCWLLMSDVNG